MNTKNNKTYTQKEVEDIVKLHCLDIARESISLDENLLNHMDSIDGIQLLIKLEDEFQIAIKDSDFDEISTKRSPTINKLVSKLKEYNVIDIKKERNEKIKKINESN